MNPPPIIVAHRGWRNHTLPENSAEAFHLAHENGFVHVECDVWASSDGEPIVIHDETLGRTTTGSGEVWRMTADELRQLKLRGPEGVATEFALPLLRDVTDLVEFLEIKTPDAPDLVRRTIELMSRRRDWVLQSFDEANLLHAQRCGNKPKSIALLVEDSKGLDTAIAGHWPTHLDHRMLDIDVMHRLRAAGVRVGVWTVNDESAIRAMVKLGVDVLITDNPPLARKMLSQEA